MGRCLIVYTTDSVFAQAIRETLLRMDDSAELVLADTPEALADAASQRSYAPVLVDLEQNARSTHYLFITLERIRQIDPLRLLLACQVRKSAQQAAHQEVFYMVLDKKDVLQDTWSIVNLTFTQQAIRRATNQTSLMLASSSQQIPSIGEVTGLTTTLDRALASRAKWKSAYARSLEACRGMAAETLGTEPRDPSDGRGALPEYWAKEAIRQVQQENARLHAEIDFLRSR